LLTADSIYDIIDSVSLRHAIDNISVDVLYKHGATGTARVVSDNTFIELAFRSSKTAYIDIDKLNCNALIYILKGRSIDSCIQETIAFHDMLTYLHSECGMYIHEVHGYILKTIFGLDASGNVNINTYNEAHKQYPTIVPHEIVDNKVYKFITIMDLYTTLIDYLGSDCHKWIFRPTSTSDDNECVTYFNKSYISTFIMELSLCLEINKDYEMLCMIANAEANHTTTVPQCDAVRSNRVTAAFAKVKASAGNMDTKAKSLLQILRRQYT
jgi:hypothetical protein